MSKFEQEIDDRVSAHLSNTNLSNNRSAFNDVRDPESRNDLTQSLLSDQSGTFNDPNKDPYKANENGDYNVSADKRSRPASQLFDKADNIKAN